MSDYEVVKKVFEKSSWMRTDFHDKIDYPLNGETTVEGKSIWIYGRYDVSDLDGILYLYKQQLKDCYKRH